MNGAAPGEQNFCRVPLTARTVTLAKVVTALGADLMSRRYRRNARRHRSVLAAASRTGAGRRGRRCLTIRTMTAIRTATTASTSSATGSSG
jgi:hypothetical protein